MNKNGISIATITWARDESEEELLRASLQEIGALHIPVFITDGGSTKAFLDFLESFPDFVLLKGNARGVWAQSKNSLSAACQSGSKFVFYTEPDKQDFFRNGLPPMLEISLHEQSGIITASRSESGFATFPAFQRMTEATINNCCRELIGNPIDYTYGPFILNSQLIPYLELVQEDIGWGWRPYMFGMAKRLGYQVDAFVGDFFCPPAQREDNKEERIYRMRQLSQNIKGLVLSTSIALA